jgi:hypothetical protein
MRILFASLLLAAACNSAYADRVAVAQVGPRIALAVSPDKVRAPYDVQIISESGETQPTFAQKGRYYVLGNDGDRYTIRVTNPTGNRVEAVVSVDGLDVVDGEEGDLRKRGYIVPAYGEVRIEGFRTSLADVATFRFSGVDSSYAGKKGKARNVGVIAVAIFEEAAPPPDQQIVAPEVARRNMDRDWGTDEEEGQASMDAPRSRSGAGGGRVAHHTAKADKKAAQAETTTASRPSTRPAPQPAPPPAANGVMGGAAGAPAPKAAESRREAAAMDDGDYYEPPTEQVAPKTGRAGLGTEFGEQRYSAAAYTKFVRANNRPIAIAELRYNDRAGLVALGIPLEPSPDENEIMMRETADPFPGDGRFATPPR